MKKIIDNIYSSKIELMGFAILILMIFHSSIPSFYGFKNVLEIGVDIFLFLGGFTCSLSYSKLKQNNQNPYLKYYVKRLWRILPPYLILYSFIYAIEYLFKDHYNWSKFWGELTMWDNLVHNSISMWYVPAIILMYLIIPIYIDCYRKWQSILLLPFVLIFLLMGIVWGGKMSLIPFSMFWVRLPIFLLGINTFLLRNQKIIFNNYLVLFVAFVALILCLILDNAHQLALKRLCYIPIVFAIIHFYDLNKYGSRTFRWAGSFSYENYLIHGYILKVIYDYTAGVVISKIMSLPYFSLFSAYKLGLEALYASIIALPISLIIAYSYHKLLNLTIYKKKL